MVHLCGSLKVAGVKPCLHLEWGPPDASLALDAGECFFHCSDVNPSTLL